MTVFGGIPDQDELRATARTRARRGRLVVFGILLLGAVTLTATTLVTADHAPSFGKTIVLLLPVIFTVVVVVVLYPFDPAAGP